MLREDWRSSRRCVDSSETKRNETEGLTARAASRLGAEIIRKVGGHDQLGRIGGWERRERCMYMSIGTGIVVEPRSSAAHRHLSHALAHSSAVCSKHPSNLLRLSSLVGGNARSHAPRWRPDTRSTRVLFIGVAAGALGSTKLRILPEFRAHVHARQTVDIFSVRAIVHQSSARHRRVIVRLRASRPSVSLRARRRTTKDLRSPRLARTSACAGRTDASTRRDCSTRSPSSIVSPPRASPRRIFRSARRLSSPRLSARCRQCTSPPTSPTERSRGR